MIKNSKQAGFTLIEVIIVIVISGILVSTAMRAGQQLFDTAKVETTKTEMNLIAVAMIGDPTLHNANTPASFGYVGDVGALPASLDNLITNPGSYATWNGPYVDNDFVQNTTDYKKDAWGTDYSYSGSLTIASTGSGNTLTRTLASSTADLLLNRVTGLIADLSGRPPGSVYKDSLQISLTIPNGTGGYLTKTTTPDLGGYFEFDSIPIGNHDLEIIFTPSLDTLDRFVTVLSNSSTFGEYQLSIDTTGAAGGSGILEYVSGTGTANGADCDDITFDVINSSGSAVDITSMTISWASPTAYFKRLKLGVGNLFNSQNPRKGSGDLITFSTETIAAGETVTFQSIVFCSNSTGNCSSPTNMQNTTFTVLFSNGSTFDFTVGSCP